MRLYNSDFHASASSRVYESVDSDGDYLKQINHLSPVEQKLELKVGAQVRNPWISWEDLVKFSLLGIYVSQFYSKFFDGAIKT